MVSLGTVQPLYSCWVCYPVSSTVVSLGTVQPLYSCWVCYPVGSTVVSLELYSSCTAVGFVIQSAVRLFLLNCTAIVQLLGLLASRQYDVSHVMELV